MTTSGVKKQKVPPLELGTVSDGIRSISPCRDIRVMLSNVPVLQTDDDMTHLHNVYEAKRALSARTDVTYYITADDLLLIQQTKTPIRLRLCIDSSTPTSTSNPQNPRSHRASSDLSRGRSPTNSPTGSPSMSRPKLKHNKSVDGESSGDRNHRHSDPRKHITVHTMTSIPSMPACNDITKQITLRSGMFRIVYDATPIAYQYFIIEEYERGRLICRGLTDMQVRGDVLITYEYSTVNSPGAKLSATVYSPNIMKTEMPIYLHISCDREITIERVVEMLPDLIDLAQTQYNTNDVSHRVDSAIKEAW